MNQARTAGNVTIREQRSYVALLRGINVGGNNMVSMAVLKASFEALGFGGVRTYINSGNVLFQSASTDSRALEVQIEKGIAAHFSQPIRVIVRSQAEMKALLAAIPKSWHDLSDKRCNVIFLRHTVDSPSIMKNFHPKEGVEEVHYVPGALFWSAQLDSITKSTMIKLNGNPLYQDMTIRILNTVRKLDDLLEVEQAAK